MVVLNLTGMVYPVTVAVELCGKFPIEMSQEFLMALSVVPLMVMLS